MVGTQLFVASQGPGTIARTQKHNSQTGHSGEGQGHLKGQFSLRHHFIAGEVEVSCLVWGLRAGSRSKYRSQDSNSGHLAPEIMLPSSGSVSIGRGSPSVWGEGSIHDKCQPHSFLFFLKSDLFI